jgi:hypothetical protein
MKSLISTIVTLGGMGLWWLYARDSGYSTVVDLLGLLAIGVLAPFIVERMIPR